MDKRKNNSDFKRDLIKRSIDLSKKTIHLVDKFPKKNATWVISDQLLRSVTSIGANFVEAQSSVSKREFVKFLSIALKSGNESKYWFFLSKELDRSLSERIDELINETEELVKIIGASISTLKGHRKL